MPKTARKKRKTRIGHVSLLKAPKSKPYDWRCVWPEKDGKRREKYFHNKGDAEKYQREQNEVVEEAGHAGHVTEEERAAVVEFREELEKVGLSVRSALVGAIERQKRLSRSADVSQLVAERIADRERAGLSDSYIKDLRHRLKRFEITFGPRPVADIEPVELDDWLFGLDLSPASVANFRRALVGLFNEAIKRRYTESNPAQQTSEVKFPDKTPGILTPKEAAALLSVADAKILPSLVVGLFCGVRQAEIARLDWSHVNLAKQRLDIPAEVSKTGKRRLVEIPKNAVEWLSPQAVAGGPIQPPNFRRMMDRAKDLAGFRGRMPTGGKPAERKQLLALWRKRKTWPSNALRHSYASYHYAAYQDAGKTAHQLGHKGNPAMLHEHYDAVAEPEDAAEFWAIRPVGEKAENVVAIA